MTKKEKLELDEMRRQICMCGHSRANHVNLRGAGGECGEPSFTCRCEKFSLSHVRSTPLGPFDEDRADVG